MSECTAYLERGIVKDVCKHCGKVYIVRDNKKGIWQPATDIPTGPAASTDVPLCYECVKELVEIINKFLRQNGKKEKVL